MQDKLIQLELKPGAAVRVDYTNHRGERSVRDIKVISVWRGVSPFHEGEQWFVSAVDVERGVVRDFALADMKPVGNPP